MPASFLTTSSSCFRPISLLIAYRVLSGFVTACLLAGAPTVISSPYATTEGVVLAPSEFSMTLGLSPSITDTQELVVPKSMPIIFAIFLSPD